MKAVIDRLHPIGMVLLSVIVVNLLIPRYGILTIEYIDPNTPMTITQSEIVDELCQFIEQDSFKCDFDYSQPLAIPNRRSKTLILTKDEWLKLKASENKIKKATREAEERNKRGNLQITK